MGFLRDHHLFRTEWSDGTSVQHGYRYDSSDSMRSSHPDCLSVTPGFTTDQHVLGAPPRHRRPDFRSYGSACCTCSGTCQRLGRGRGRGKGKLASDQK
ncbi:hypothetical protein E5676_scaffold726G00160 [Cucumis melo var. makuwa]|uniref:NBS-LRR type resistance protein n=1 Tax=Cucumis melo var. makuwa TaxID=1194695 RepID=A0A5A7U638_CUCMM|nr:hypothetical protein E6C27_scaffold560G00270 [Cucumis melo var. makuwa]TYJ95689.1 hypothetical protein E5676_scaffold726G00160 [Cucumis melo var. makuwa]